MMVGVFIRSGSKCSTLKPHTVQTIYTMWSTFIQNVWGYTALLEAVCYSNKDAVGRLLEAGCDVTFREVRSGESALHVAVRKNYSVITQQLLAFGAGLGPVYNYQVSNPGTMHYLYGIAQKWRMKI